MENCFVRSRVFLLCLLSGILFFAAGSSLGADTNPTMAAGKDNIQVAMEFLPSRSTVGMGPNENFINPSIAVSEEYTDNVFGTESNRRTDFITHITPGLALKYRAPFWDWDLAYLLDYRYYARNSRSYDFAHDLNVKGNMRVIENFLFLDLNETFKRVSLDVNRDTTADTTFVNQSDQNIVTVAPHIEFHPGANFLVKSGYHYTNEMYSNSSQLGASATGVDKEEHGAFVTTSHELTQRSTFSTNFYYAHVATGLGLSYHQMYPTLGIRYEYADKSFINLEGGYTWFLYANGPTTSGPYWNAGIMHAFDHTTASFNTLVRYNTDPLRGSTEARDFVGKLDKILERGSFGVSATYSELRDNQQDTLISRRYAIGGNIKHELTEKLTGHLDLTGEKVNRYDNINLNNDITAPYRFYIATGVNYVMANKLTLSLDYSYTTYRKSIDSSDNNTEINRVFLKVSKVF